MWVFLGSEIVFFGVLIGTMLILRFVTMIKGGVWMDEHTLEIISSDLSIYPTIFITFVLLMSSVSMMKAVEAVERSDRSALRNWINNPPSESDLQPYKSEGAAKRKLIDSLDFIIILPKTEKMSDVSLNGEPSGIVNGIIEQKKLGTGAVHAEGILTYGSILILVFVIFRTVWGI